MMVESEFKDVKFIQSTENVGFARANNQGFENTSGKILLFLNPDTEVLDNAIQTMYSFLLNKEDAGIVGCKLLNTDLSVQTNCIKPLPTFINELFDIDLLKIKFSRLKIFGIQSLFNSTEPTIVGVINGACIMIKRNIFEKINGFDTNYFMYSEDVDLAYKVKQTGLNSYFIPMVSIIHHGGKSTLNKKNVFYSVLLLRESRYLFFKITRGIFYAQLYRLATLIASFIRMLILIILFPLSLINKKSQMIYISFVKWKNILRWSLGFEGWTKTPKNV
jgi:GT2 family glycosyltransferase